MQFDHVLSVYERMLSPKHPLRIKAMADKADALGCLGRLVESLALFKAALLLARQVFDHYSRILVALEVNMALTLGELGMYEEAAEVHERLMRAMERSPLFGPSDFDTWISRINHCRTVVVLGSFAEAVPLLQDSLAAFDGMGLGREHPVLGTIPQHYGEASLGVGRAEQAVPMFQRSIAFTEHQFGFHHYLIPDNLIQLATAYKQLGRCSGERRIPLLDRAVAIRELSIRRDKEKDAGPLGAALQAAASCYEEAGRLAEAEALWIGCVAAFTKARCFLLHSTLASLFSFVGSLSRNSHPFHPLSR